MTIDKELKKILDNQQEKIINDKSKYLCVSACPGAGKTYTLVKKIERELDDLKDWQGIIACSFTKESSKEIKKRLGKKNNKLDNCFINTIDSMVLNLIIKPFLNRYLFGKQLIKQRVSINRIEEEKNNKVKDYVRLYNKNNIIHERANEYIKEWYENLKKGIYKISFPSYLLAERIVKMNLFNKYFALRYPTIYIDEAQDLDCFQHKFLQALKENTSINIILFGDPYQSIYQFRGAQPELFSGLLNQGYYARKITVSVRCHPSILFYANKIFDSNVQKLFDEPHVKIIYEIDLEFLKSLNGNTFILVETNPKGIELYEKYKDDFDILYSKKLDNMPEDYNLNENIMDELIKYYVNYDNLNDRYKYPLEDLVTYLNNTIGKVYIADFKINKRNFVDYMIDSVKVLNLDVSHKTINILNEKLNDKKYKYYYYILDKPNRIMTIHGSKGLETDNVIIYLTNTHPIDDQFKRKLFVAITRAKKNVFIYYEKGFSGVNYIQELING